MCDVKVLVRKFEPGLLNVALSYSVHYYYIYSLYAMR